MAYTSNPEVTVHQFSRYVKFFRGGWWMVDGGPKIVADPVPDPLFWEGGTGHAYALAPRPVRENTPEGCEPVAGRLRSCRGTRRERYPRMEDHPTRTLKGC